MSFKQKLIDWFKIPSTLLLESNDLIDLHNHYRAKFQLLPLTLDPKLQAAADKHSMQQARINKMAHVGIGDSTPAARISAEGYKWAKIAENVAWNQGNANSVMNSWINSPAHRANILGNYKDIGVSVAGYYWTVCFGNTNQVMLMHETSFEVGKDLIMPYNESKI